MKTTLTYIVGSVALLPSLLLFTDNFVAITFAAIWSVFMWNMPRLLPSTKRFWRKWWAVNIKLTNAFIQL